MNNWVKILIGIAVLLGLMWVMSTVAGLLFWGVIALVIGALVYALVRKWRKKRQSHKTPKGLLEEETVSDIDRLIKDMERMTGKSRICWKWPKKKLRAIIRQIFLR